jgi:hypothetical protein
VALAEYRRVLGLVLGRKARLEWEAGRRTERLAALKERLAAVRTEAVRLARERNWIELHRCEIIEADCRRDLERTVKAAETAKEAVVRTRAT